MLEGTKAAHRQAYPRGQSARGPPVDQELGAVVKGAGDVIGRRVTSALTPHIDHADLAPATAPVDLVCDDARPRFGVGLQPRARPGVGIEPDRSGHATDYAQTATRAVTGGS